jgi:hypothetical protein
VIRGCLPTASVYRIRKSETGREDIFEIKKVLYKLHIRCGHYREMRHATKQHSALIKAVAKQVRLHTF